MFEQKLADHYDDICAWPAAATVAAPEEIDSSDVPWPPDLEAGESKIWGHSGSGLQTNKSNPNLFRSNQIYPDQIKSNGP